MIWQLVGMAAATLTMFSFVPQIIKVWRTKSARDVSVITLCQMAAGVTLWMAYGVYLRDVIIITANGVTLASMVVLLAQYVAYGRNPR